MAPRTPTEALLAMRNTVWTYKQFIAMLAIVAAISTAILKVQDEARDDMRADFTAQIAVVTVWLQECRAGLEECNRWFREALAEKRDTAILTDDQ